jgi:hypothetical protein
MDWRLYNSFVDAFSQFAKTSVADPGCLSRIPDPDFYPSRIPDPKTATKERGENFFFFHTFLCSHKFHKIVNYFSFEVLKKKIWANFQKNCQKALKNMVLGSGIRDPGSGKNLFRIPDPGVKKAPDPGSGSSTLAKTHLKFILARSRSFLLVSTVLMKGLLLGWFIIGYPIFCFLVRYCWDANTCTRTRSSTGT